MGAMAQVRGERWGGRRGGWGGAGERTVGGAMGWEERRIGRGGREHCGGYGDRDRDRGRMSAEVGAETDSGCGRVGDTGRSRARGRDRHTNRNIE
eukprot:6181554-Pleurochrysis_carterae.AAC.2